MSIFIILDVKKGKGTFFFLNWMATWLHSCLYVSCLFFLRDLCVFSNRRLAVTDSWAAMLKRTTVGCVLETAPPVDWSEVRLCHTSHLKNVGTNTYMSTFVLKVWLNISNEIKMKSFYAVATSTFSNANIIYCNYIKHLKMNNGEKQGMPKALVDSRFISTFYYKFGWRMFYSQMHIISKSNLKQMKRWVHLEQHLLSTKSLWDTENSRLWAVHV